MKTFENASPDYVDLGMERAIARIQASIAHIFAAGAATTSGSKREPPTARNAPHITTEQNTNPRKEALMSTLTANRILQKGDEYKDNGAWKPVPAKELGLQVMFSKLKGREIRRPSEKDFHAASPAEGNLKRAAQDGRKPDAVRKEHDHGIPQLVVSPQVSKSQRTSPTKADADNGAERSVKPLSKPDALSKTAAGHRRLILSPDSGLGVRTENPAKAEKSKQPAPSSSGAGTLPSVDYPAVVLAQKDRHGLPTVVSVKAHAWDDPDGEEIPAAFVAPIAEVMFTKNGSKPTWTGRNGTFNGYGVIVYKPIGENKILLQPRGKRGPGNCLIEIPLEDIPELIKALAQLTK